MKLYEYEVVFETGRRMNVYAAEPVMARIIAQAAEIDLGNNYAVASVTKIR